MIHYIGRAENPKTRNCFFLFIITLRSRKNYVNINNMVEMFLSTKILSYEPHFFIYSLNYPQSTIDILYKVVKVQLITYLKETLDIKRLK